MKRILQIIAALLLATLVALGIWLWDPLPTNPDTEALSAPAANYTVEIVRDEWGVPHIFGESDADTSFGLAYAHAEDDFETIQETVIATRGDLARYRGMDAAATDYIVALFEVWATVDARYNSDIPQDVKAIAEAYAAGLNLYAAQNPDATWAGIAPFTGEDVVAGFIFKTPFFYGLDETLLSLFADTRTAQIALDPASTQRDAWTVGTRSPAERGSNAVAVAPIRSGDGATRLLINSHQPMTGPVAWYEAHLIAENGIDIQGGIFPGTPVILHGFNRHLGWANTVSNPDLADVYRLDINPDNPRQYQLDGAWHDFEVSTAEIRVKLFGPFAYTAHRDVLRSQHGPVIEAPHGTYAIRYAGMGEIRQLEQYYRLNQSTDLESFLAAMAMNALPSINYIYGDQAGNIAFIHNGQYPDRTPGWDWSGDMPGDRSDLIWPGYLPFSAVPTLINPDSGLIFNANNSPFSASDTGHNLNPEDFPPEMGLQGNQTNRSLRLMEMTAAMEVIDRAGLLRIKFDTTYAQGSEADGVVRAVLAQDWSGNAALETAAAHLADWNYRMDIDSRHAALGGLTVMRAITEKYTHIPAPEPRDAFIEAVEYLTTHYGRIDPEWGEVNRLVHGAANLPVSGGPDILRAIYPAEIRDDGQLHASAGDTWIALVAWDADGNIDADVVHQFGSATRDITSPHYADQAPLFAREEWRKAMFDEADIRASATRTYRPQD